jgi:hypothetical protein
MSIAVRADRFGCTPLAFCQKCGSAAAFHAQKMTQLFSSGNVVHVHKN